jgi:hypothetical protein
LEKAAKDAVKIRREAEKRPTCEEGGAKKKRGHL